MSERFYRDQPEYLKAQRERFRESERRAARWLRVVQMLTALVWGAIALTALHYCGGFK